MSNIPVATQWTLDAAGPTGRVAAQSVFMVVCPATSLKGTGFILKNGWLLTNAHVVKGNDAKGIVGISAMGEQIRFVELHSDSSADLALLKPATPIPGGLDLDTGKPPAIGSVVTTWGFPLGYNGPSPLLSVGYLAGFVDRGGITPHLVVNGAFNPGNSGGPLFRADSDKAIGVVVSKHAPISQFQLSAIKALAENSSGVVFTAKDGAGNEKQFVESQLVADLLDHFRDLTQVMIGEAISSATVSDFLKRCKL